MTGFSFGGGSRILSEAGNNQAGGVTAGGQSAGGQQTATSPATADAGLVAAMARGDEAAFEIFVKRHFDIAYRVAWRVMGGAGDAEDVVQEAFVKLWRSPGQIRDAGAARAWLLRVVSNLAIDRLRKKQPESMAEPPDMADVRADPATDLQASQLSGRIDQAIAALPERQRLALVLTYFEGQPNQTTAEALGVSVDAVESLLARARRGLKTLLADDWRDMLAELETLDRGPEPQR